MMLHLILLIKTNSSLERIYLLKNPLTITIKTNLIIRYIRYDIVKYPFISITKDKPIDIIKINVFAYHIHLNPLKHRNSVQFLQILFKIDFFFYHNWVL